MQGSAEESLHKSQIVLLGIGHTNAHVLSQWKMKPIPDASLTCISNYPTATYSGMLPAVLAGQKSVDEMEIDLVQLCEAANATLLIDDVTGLDHAQRQLHLSKHPPVSFDVLSIGIGSVPNMSRVEATAGSIVTIKPMQTFLDRLRESIKLRKFENDRLLNIIVVGGGAAGIEISCCLPGFLTTQIGQRLYKISIVNRGDEILSGSSKSARRRALKTLQKKGVSIVTGRSVVQATSDHVGLDNGEKLPADLVIWATGATAPPLLEKLNLPVSKNGFLLTDQTLRSVSCEPIFAVGDTGTIKGEEIPKAGVFAVRQGPVLWKNIKNELTGKPLQAYSPQRSFLRLLNTGDRSAIAEWFGLSTQGQWVRALKDWIDSSFVSNYQIPTAPPIDSQAMQCRGCGSKLAGYDLMQGLSGLSIDHDDAAIVDIDETSVAISTDFFSAPFRDPFLNGRVAAIHAATDLCAIGATLISAVANVVVPQGDASMQQRFVAEILAGAQLEFAAMSPEMKIVGGHTCVGPRAEIGFTVIGKTPVSPFRKANAQAGDALFLTKPLGTGVLMAAHRQAQCKAAWWKGLMQSMLLHSTDIAQLARSIGVSAVTDVTGFGLMGHLHEILIASGTRAALNVSDIPFLEGAEELSARGFRSSLFEKNCIIGKDSKVENLAIEIKVSSRTLVPLLFDPQTCGGLLLCVQPSLIDEFQSKCDEAGIMGHRIGVLKAEQEQSAIVLLGD